MDYFSLAKDILYKSNALYKPCAWCKTLIPQDEDITYCVECDAATHYDDENGVPDDSINPTE